MGPTLTPTSGGIQIVGADNLAQSDAGRAIITFGRDLQTEYEGPIEKVIDITENGEYDVKEYQIANVNVSGGIENLTLFPCKVTTIGNTGSNTVKFHNVLAGPSADVVMFYPEISARDLSNNGLRLFYPISTNMRAGVFFYVTYGSQSVSVSPGANTTGGTATWSNTTVTEHTYAAKPNALSVAEIELVFTFT